MVTLRRSRRKSYQAPQMTWIEQGAELCQEEMGQARQVMGLGQGAGWALAHRNAKRLARHVEHESLDVRHNDN